MVRRPRKYHRLPVAHHQRMQCFRCMEQLPTDFNIHYKLPLIVCDNTVFKDAHTLHGVAVRVFFVKRFEGDYMNLHRDRFEGWVMNIKERGHAPEQAEKNSPLSYAETLLAELVPPEQA